MGEIWLGGNRLLIVQGFYTSRGALGTEPNRQTTSAVTWSHSGSHCHLWIDSTGILNQNLLLPSEDISHHILPCHCPGLPSRQPYSFVTHSDSSLSALSLSSLCLWDRPNGGGRRVRHGDPDVHCRILLWIPHREQFSVPASPGCLCHLQPCPASWLGSTGTAQAKPML